MENGVRIKNIEAGSLFEMNNGARDNFRYTNAVFSNSLFLDYLLDNGLKLWKGTMTRDIIGIEFEMGSRSQEEEIKHLEKTKRKYSSLGQNEVVVKIDDLITKANEHPEYFIKASKEQIREFFYQDGVNVSYVTRAKNGAIKKTETIHYKMLYRSVGKAKKGCCMFVCDRLYNKAIQFLRMGIKLKKENAPIVEISAYSSLVSSAIVGKIRISPKDVFVFKDVDSYTTANVVSVEINEQKNCLARLINNYKIKNTMFDGQALIDKSVFPSWGNGYVLLRHHFCKMAAFNTNLQLFFQDYFGDSYDTATLVDMFGVAHLVKDIKLITTENAMKWTKFNISYDYWCDWVEKNNCEFGVVKTAHESKLGEVQRMSYQMVNTLNEQIMPQVVQHSVDYITRLKSDDEVFLEYLRKNSNFVNDFDVLLALVEQDRCFLQSSYFRQRRKHIIENYILNFKSGHINQNGDNLTLVGSPYAMLLACVGEEVERDVTLQQSPSDNAIRCYSERFANDVYLAGFRSPHNSPNNIVWLKNEKHCLMKKYFNFGKQILAVNVCHTDIQDRANGCDFDSDSFYVTDQVQIVEHAKNCQKLYPTIVNNIPKESKCHNSDLLSFARMDNELAAAQRAIGESSNLAQIALTYTYNFNEQKYKDYVCILSVLAQCAIDNAKRRFDIDLVSEIKRIKKDMEVSTTGYPIFWGVVKKDFNKDLIDESLSCPMNYLYYQKFPKCRSELSTLPMSCFFNKYELAVDRRKCKKVEDLIAKYSWNVYQSAQSPDGFSITQNDFDDLIDNIKQVYISQNYLGLIAWLIDRSFGITKPLQANAARIDKKVSMNRAIMLKTLYQINPKMLLKVMKFRTPTA